MKKIFCILLILFCLFSLGATTYIYDDDGSLNEGEIDFIGTTEEFDSLTVFFNLQLSAFSQIKTVAPEKTIETVFELSEKEENLMWSLLKDEEISEGDIYLVRIANKRHELYIIAEIIKSDEDFSVRYNAFELTDKDS